MKYNEYNELAYINLQVKKPKTALYYIIKLGQMIYN